MQDEMTILIKCYMGEIWIQVTSYDF